MNKLTVALIFAVLVTIMLAPFALAQEPAQCEFEYTVQDGDWLSRIAEKYFGDPLTFVLIVAVNNADAADNYTDIANADVIEPGWLLCIPSDGDASTGPQAAPEGLSQEALANATYQSTWTQDGTVTLVNGEYSEPAAPGSATMTTVTLTDNIAYGELNGQPAAAVILATDPGGSGTFYDLAIVVNQDGQPVNVALTNLGDRIQINGLKIENNQVVIDMVQAGPDDPLCCPSQQVINTYSLEGDQLVEVSSEVVSDETMMPDEAELAGTNWILTTLNGQPVAPGTTVTANFTDDGMVNGSGGCNTYSYSFEVDGDNLSFGPGRTTLMACEGPAGSQESAYFAALEATTGYQINNDSLELLDSEGNVVATFSAARAVSLVGTPWLVRSYNNGRGAVVSVIIGTELTANFDENGNMAGSAGCNSYTAAYETDGANISIGPAAASTMECTEPEGIMTQEAEYLAALPTASTYTMDIGTVNMRTADGATVVNLVAAVTGQVTAAVGSSLPDDALIQVQLQDVSLADAPATVLGEQTISASGNQFPFPFEVTYNPAGIDPRLTYALRVRITTAEGQLLYINTQAYQVLTNGNPAFGVEVMVEPVQ